MAERPVTSERERLADDWQADLTVVAMFPVSACQSGSGIGMRTHDCCCPWCKPVTFQSRLTCSRRRAR